MKRPISFAAALTTLALLAGCQSAPPQALAAPAVKAIEVNGVRLSYIEQGQGVPVVLVHGAFSDARAWEPQREAVAACCRFIALTQRYFGAEPWPDAGQQYSQQTHLADLAAFIRALDTGPVHLVGRSYGATLALILATQQPTLVRSVLAQEPSIAAVVTDTADLKLLADERAGLAAARQASNAGRLAEATRLFADWTNDNPGGFDAMPAAARNAQLDNARTLPLHFASAPGPRVTCADLGQLKMPVVMTTGAQTRPFFRLFAEAAQRCIPGARLVRIADARHAATAQNPAAVNVELLALVKARP
jgi:pimeloyl-ACP methyl ester carboxylesterase